jgi:hypothetical protein
VQWAISGKPSDTKSRIVFQELLLLVGWGGGLRELNFMAIKVLLFYPVAKKMPRNFLWNFKLPRDYTKNWLGDEMTPAEGTRILHFESGESFLSWAIFASLHVLTSASLIIRGNGSQIS